MRFKLFRCVREQSNKTKVEKGNLLNGTFDSCVLSVVLLVGVLELIYSSYQINNDETKVIKEHKKEVDNLN